MALDLVTRAAALIAVLGTAVVYGTDVFCAVVLRPALASVDETHGSQSPNATSPLVSTAPNDPSGISFMGHNAFH